MARPHVDVAVLATGVLLIGMVIGLDLVVFDRGLAEEGPPIFSVAYLVRTATIALGSAAIVVGARMAAVRTLDRADRSGRAVDAPFAAAIGAAPAIVSMMLLVGDPALLSRLVREDQIVEWASAVFAFGAAVAFAAAVPRLRRRSSPGVPAVLVMAGVCLLLGLEEISWFQRVFDVESPDFMLNRNGQHETNLHNLATGATGNLYYVGACAYLVLMAIAVGDRVLPSRLTWLQSVVPSGAVLLGSATASGFVYAMWNIAWIQATFWMTLTALLVAARSRRDRRLAVVLALLTGLTAAVFLLVGDSMIRDWDDTEIRELVIPYGLLLSGLGAVRRAAPDSVRR